MNYQTNDLGAARHIVRSAKQKIKEQTGLKVSIMLYGQDNLWRGPAGMMQVIAIALNMDPGSYAMKARCREIVDLRSLAALLMRAHFPGVTLTQIAHLFGGQDHSSIISGIERAKNLLHTHDEHFVNKYKKALKSVELWLERQASGYASAISA